MNNIVIVDVVVHIRMLVVLETQFPPSRNQRAVGKFTNVPEKYISKNALVSVMVVFHFNEIENESATFIARVVRETPLQNFQMHRLFVDARKDIQAVVTGLETLKSPVRVAVLPQILRNEMELSHGKRRVRKHIARKQSICKESISLEEALANIPIERVRLQNIFRPLAPVIDIDWLLRSLTRHNILRVRDLEFLESPAVNETLHLPAEVLVRVDHLFQLLGPSNWHRVEPFNKILTQICKSIESAPVNTELAIDVIETVVGLGEVATVMLKRIW